MDAVAACFGGDLAFDVHAEQGEVADDVEDLVADEFVVEAQGSFVEHPVGREHDRIVERPAERDKYAANKTTSSWLLTNTTCCMAVQARSPVDGYQRTRNVAWQPLSTHIWRPLFMVFQSRRLAQLDRLCCCHSVTGFLPNVLHVFLRPREELQRTYLYGLSPSDAAPISTRPEISATTEASAAAGRFSIGAASTTGPVDKPTIIAKRIARTEECRPIRFVSLVQGLFIFISLARIQAVEIDLSARFLTRNR